jgi:SAM-dependent methyltransferase
MARRIGGTLCLAIVWASMLPWQPAGAQDADADRERYERVADLLAALDVRSGSRVADVGAGDGFHTARIGKLVGPTGSVVAVDISESALAKLRERLKRDGIINVEVQVGAADDPRLPAGSLDAVLINNSYHEMPQHESMLRAIRAALKPGGRLVLSEPIHENLRNRSRADQTKEHELADEIVLAELQAGGFEIIRHDPRFSPFTAVSNPGGWWLIVARKPRD